MRGYTSLGFSLKRIPGKEQEELAVREKIVRLRPEWLIARFGLAQSLRTLGRYEDSLAQIKTAFKMMTPAEERQRDSLMNRAACLASLGNLTAAITDFDHILFQNSDHR